ncbi:MAG TPA: nuclear transport factor 2 family protein [Solirubrobacteraceae bacterium]|jgi:hypothetical protein|nr:nuclear transport factor 2 family protein [Solirubrobacteraceae bacterium]
MTPPTTHEATSAAAHSVPSSTGSPEERYVARWREGWSYGASQRCLDEHATTIFDEHTLYIQPLFDAVAGERGMRELFEGLFALIRGLRVELDHWAVNDGVALIEFTLTGTIGGKPIRVRGVDRMQLNGDKLVLRETHLDPLPLLIALLSRPRAWPRALRNMRAHPRPRLHPSRTPRTSNRKVREQP